MRMFGLGRKSGWRIVDLQMSMLGLGEKHAGRGVGGEAKQHEQSFLLTCLAIQWICIRMCMTKTTWRIVDLHMGMLNLGEKNGTGGFSMSMSIPHALRLVEFVCVYSIVNWRCIREHLCPKSRMIKFIFKCTILALNEKVGGGGLGGEGGHMCKHKNLAPSAVKLTCSFHSMTMRKCVRESHAYFTLAISVQPFHVSSYWLWPKLAMHRAHIVRKVVD